MLTGLIFIVSESIWLFCFCMRVAVEGSGFITRYKSVIGVGVNCKNHDKLINYSTVRVMRSCFL